MDITDTITPNSEQLNAEDLLVGPRTYTVTGVEEGTADQPVFIHLSEVPGRTYRPAKTMRRVLIACWGTEASNYVGRRMTLFNDQTVMWAGKPVGGIRIAALSHIDEAKEINLTVTRGKRALFVVQPLTDTVDTSGRDWLAELELAGDDRDAVEALGFAAKAAHAQPAVLTVIRSRYLELAGGVS